MEIKIDETYHVASCCFSQYVQDVLGKNSVLHLSFMAKNTIFPQKLRVRIEDNNNSPHGKFHRFLFPFSSKFSDLNFASYVFYIYLYYVTCHSP